MREGLLNIDNPLSCNLCLECLEGCNTEPKGISVSESEDKFILVIESVGSMSARDILLQSIKEVVSQVDEVIGKFSGEVISVEKEK
jgi:DNA-directed RNA polymerase alpha subunit